MKSTILNIKKRVLVVETDQIELATLMMMDNFFPEYKLELICAGSDATEQITSQFFTYEETFDSFNRLISGYRFGGALWQYSFKCFISAIEANDYTWGNPLGSSRPMWGDIGFSKDKAGKWDKAESKTLHPEQCLIFEIL